MVFRQTWTLLIVTWQFPNENCATAWQGTVTELVVVLVTVAVVSVLVVVVHESVFDNDNCSANEACSLVARTLATGLLCWSSLVRSYGLAVFQKYVWSKYSFLKLTLFFLLKYRISDSASWWSSSSLLSITRATSVIWSRREVWLHWISRHPLHVARNRRRVHFVLWPD